MAEGSASARAPLAVTIPTRSRPGRLANCLESLGVARGELAFPVYVCDSSPAAEDRDAVSAVCERYDWVRLRPHDGSNVSAARNHCAAVTDADLLVNVDDDLQLEPAAIERLLAAYRAGTGWRVVSGNVAWNDQWVGPKKMRAIGYARDPREGEQPDFVPGAFFLYPRELALALPWNERIDQCTDIFMGALWRRHRIQMLFAADARAHHPQPPQGFGPDDAGDTAGHQVWRIYALLFDALVANPSPLRALSYELLGFLAAAKLYFRRPRWAMRFLRSWIDGHRRFLRDWRHLRALAHSQVPEHG